MLTGETLHAADALLRRARSNSGRAPQQHGRVRDCNHIQYDSPAFRRDRRRSKCLALRFLKSLRAWSLFTLC
jgi:hypothetical protein